MTKLSLFEQKGTFIVIDHLSNEKIAIYSDLRKLVGQSALYNTINKLLLLRVLEESREHPFNKRVFKLTAKGKKVALLLQEIEKILQSE